MNEIAKHGKFLLLLALITASLAWAQNDPFDQPPPPEIEEALRSRITQFYDLFQKGKFREAEQFVAEDSRESYYIARKGRIHGFSIKEIYFGSDFKTAKALLTLKTMVPFAGSTPIDVPMGTQWAWTDENWFLVLPKARPGDQIQTPFGLKTIGPETAGMPKSSADQLEMPDIEALKKMWLFRVFSGWPTGSRLLHPADPTSPAVTSEPKRRPRNPQIPYTPVRSWATRKGNKTLINRELSL